MRKKTFGKAGWHIAALCWLFFSVGRTEALPEYLAAAKLTYAIKPGSNIATRNCQLCHKQATNANSLNPYGKSVQSALNSASAEQLTPALLHSLDNQDPDNDGFSNASEFQADTLPGDPQSHPDGATSGVVLSNVPKPTNQAEINPFAPRRVLFAKHAQHPVLVHFPIALFLFSLFLDVLGRWRNRAGLHNVALVNLVSAAVMGGHPS